MITALKPFMDETAIETWQQRTRVKLEKEMDRKQITEQPADIITGQLKKYQLVGLDWLIERHENFVPGILADEMVRDWISTTCPCSLRMCLTEIFVFFSKLSKGTREDAASDLVPLVPQAVPQG